MSRALKVVEPQAELKRVTDEFHKVFYPLQGETTWMGHSMMKCPMDLMIYQEILYECRPDLIIECGTFRGGSALYMAHLCDIMGHGMIVSIDISRWIGLPQHPRIVYVTGSSVDPKIVKTVKGLADGFRKVMVVLDSDHTKPHVLKELDTYSELVTPRQYLIVEDSDIHGHPVRDDLPPGPYEAVEAWLPKHSDFYADKSCEKFLLTQNPGGYLRRT